MYGELKVHVFLSTGIFVYIVYIFIYKVCIFSPEHFIRIINGSPEVLYLLSIVNINVFKKISMMSSLFNYFFVCSVITVIRFKAPIALILI